MATYDYNLLSRLDCDVPIVFFASKWCEYDEIAGVEIRKVFNYSKKRNAIAKLVSYIASMLRVLVAVMRLRPAVIHVQWFRLKPFDLPFYNMCRSLFKAKIVLTAHDVLPHKLDNDPKGLKWQQKGFTLCDRIIVHTEASRRVLLNTFKVDERKVCIAPHGLIEAVVNDDTVKQCVANFSQKYMLSGKTVFSLLGTLSEYKGADLLIDAWCETGSLYNNPNCTLILAGKWSMSTMAKDRTLPQNLILIPRLLTNEEFAALMQLTDVLLMPYRRIDQSGLLLTALSMGVPYCATDVGELTAPLRIANVGWIIPQTDDVDALAGLIEHLANNRPEISAKRNDTVGWAKVRNAYGWENSARITSSIYAELMRGFTPPV